MKWKWSNSKEYLQPDEILKPKKNGEIEEEFIDNKAVIYNIALWLSKNKSLTHPFSP